MKRETQSVVLVLVGGTILGLSIGDLYLRYVKESMRPFLIVSALIVIALGVLAWVLDEGEPEHAHHTPRVAWLMLLPVFAVTVVNPPPLGTFVAERQATSQPPPPPAQGVTFPPLPGDGPVPLTINEFSTRAAYDAGDTLKDRPIVLTGFATPAKEGEGWLLNRLSLACCAADAFVNAVRVEGSPAPAKGDWVKVTGTWLPSGEPVPRDGMAALRAAEVVATEEPSQAYE